MNVDVALDARLTRRMSFGMRAYAVELARYLPVVAPDLRVVPLHGGANMGLDEQVLMPLRVARMRPQLTHYTTIFAPLLAPLPYIQMIHDLIHVVHPEFYGRGVALYYATVARRLTQRARFLVMGDERTVEQCERYLGVDPAVCRVTPLGYDPALAAQSGVEKSVRPYVLYSGNLRPHKNVATLLAAWSALPPSVEVDLYLTGDEADERFAHFESGSRRIVMLGTVSDERLWQLYRGALAYVHPALAEGFGLPMLEAMAAGTPVIASRECVSSVVRDFAALFNARDVDQLRSLLADVAQGSAAWRERAARGKDHVRPYTWERFAMSTVAVYREVLEESA
jgi:glycosyltransferase involved in cell wall biosynthesis